MIDALRPMAPSNRIPGLRTVPRIAVLISLLVAMFALPAAWGQQIYKTVDENGNVVYTDQKPSDDAEPIPLPELTVVDPVEIGDPDAVEPSSVPDVDPVQFTIAAPLADEVIVNTGFRLDVEIDLDAQLPPGVQIVYLVDGEEKLSSRETTVTLEGIERGPHQVSAEIRARNGQVLGSAPPVSFFMRQQSALYNRPG